MGLSGLEPPTSRLSGVRSNQLSYKPTVEMKRFELSTPCLQGRCSPQLSYIPVDLASTCSPTVSSAVPSASWVLTVVFGMGTGGVPKRIDARNIVIQL